MEQVNRNRVEEVAKNQESTLNVGMTVSLFPVPEPEIRDLPLEPAEILSVDKLVRVILNCNILITTATTDGIKFQY